jgi:hypothetical protein
MPVFTDYPTTKPTTLSDMLGNISNLQNFQQQQQLMPLQLERAQLETQRARETNPSEIARLQSLSRQQLGTEKPAIIQQEELAKQSQTATQKSLFDLSKEQSGELNKIYSSLIGDPRLIGPNVNKDTAASALHDADQQAQRLDLGPNKDLILKGLTGPLYGVAVSKPDKLHDALINLNKQAMSPSERQGFVSGTQAVEGTDIAGNPTIREKNPYTGQIVQKPLPFQGTEPMRFRPGQSAETVKAMQVERLAAKDAASAVATSLNNIDTVLKYLPLASTGKESEFVSGIQSLLGNLAGSTKEEKAASARDIIQKNIADLSLSKNTALGGKFVESLKLAENSLADAGKNITAIEKSMEQLRPLLQHAKYYQQGLEATIAKRGGDIQAKTDYDNAMIKIFDPNILTAYNIYKKSGASGLNKFVIESLPPSEKNNPQSIAAKKQELSNGLNQYQKLVKGDL